MSAQCDACGADLIWATTPAGKRAPIVAATDGVTGNVLLVEAEPLGVIAVTLSGDALALAQQAHARLHLNHWATCPHRDALRAAMSGQGHLL